MHLASFLAATFRWLHFCLHGKDCFAAACVACSTMVIWAAECSKLDGPMVVTFWQAPNSDDVAFCASSSSNIAATSISMAKLTAVVHVILQALLYCSYQKVGNKKVKHYHVLSTHWQVAVTCSATQTHILHT